MSSIENENIAVDNCEKVEDEKNDVENDDKISNEDKKKKKRKRVKKFILFIP